MGWSAGKGTANNFAKWCLIFSRNNGSSLSPPGPEPGPPASFPGLPPSLLDTPNPAHLGLPESLASVTVPIRLDALSSLLHSALLGAYSMPACPCAPSCCPPQPGPAGRAAPQARGRWGRGDRGWPRPGQRGRGERPRGSWRPRQPEKSFEGRPGAGPRTPQLAPPPQTSPAHDEKKEGRLGETAPSAATAQEDWESEY